MTNDLIMLSLHQLCRLVAVTGGDSEDAVRLLTHAARANPQGWPTGTQIEGVPVELPTMGPMFMRVDDGYNEQGENFMVILTKEDTSRFWFAKLYRLTGEKHWGEMQGTKAFAGHEVEALLDDGSIVKRMFFATTI